MKITTTIVVLLLVALAIPQSQWGQQNSFRNWDYINKKVAIHQRIEQACKLGDLAEALRLHRVELLQLSGPGSRPYHWEARILMELGRPEEAQMMYECYFTRRKLNEPDMSVEDRRNFQMSLNFITSQATGKSMVMPEGYESSERFALDLALEAGAYAGDYLFKTARKLVALAVVYGLSPEETKHINDRLDVRRAEQREARRQAGLPPL